MKLTKLLDLILEESGFWGNYGCGVLAIASSTNRILVSYRSKYVMEPNTWGVIGGKVDDEDVMDLRMEAVREFKEETRYNGQIKLEPAYLFKTKGFEYQNFIGVIPDEFHAIPDWETEEFRWVTFDELMRLGPKHFGLSKLLNDQQSINLILKIIQQNKKRGY